ncbi:hypothetical protein E2C01_036790 [Portunus trituberculatus]|uniref:Uncharacterized protein n=1 Tax=Portunus trituberculatus TaxID=210409 RepID=A0A5B7F7M5_PORTR|nr:hypothetical protein [Portunus trituberculatus]
MYHSRDHDIGAMRSKFPCDSNRLPTSVGKRSAGSSLEISVAKPCTLRGVTHWEREERSQWHRAEDDPERRQCTRDAGAEYVVMLPAKPHTPVARLLSSSRSVHCKWIFIHIREERTE